MDWFAQLTGFRETDYEETRAKLRVEGERLYYLGLRSGERPSGKLEAGRAASQLSPRARRGGRNE